MTTEEARRARQLLLIEETETLIEALGRIENKLDVDSQMLDSTRKAVSRTRSAVNLALIAVLASILLWYGQARAESDSTAFTKCVATWADLSTTNTAERQNAAATRLRFEKARGDAVSRAAEDLLRGVDARKALGEIRQAQLQYNKAYKAYTKAIADNPVPESPKFSCKVAPFRLTTIDYWIGGGILLVTGLLALGKLFGSMITRIRRVLNERRSRRNSRARDEEAGGETGRSVKTKTGIRPSPRGRP